MSRSTQRSSVGTVVSLLLRCLVLSRSSSQTQREVQSARCRDHYLTVSSYFHQQAGLEVSTVVPLVVHVFKFLSGSRGPLAQPEEGPQLVWKARCTRQRTSDTAGAHASFATSHSRAGQHGSNRVSHGVVALLSDTAPRKHTFSVRTQRQCPKPFGFQCSSLRPRHIQVSGVVESTMPPPVK